MGILWEDEAWKEYLEWQKTDKKKLTKINQLVRDIQRSPFEGIGKPERLSEELAEYWSRRIDDKNRVVYRMLDGNLVIISCKTHYGDK